MHQRAACRLQRPAPGSRGPAEQRTLRINVGEDQRRSCPSGPTKKPDMETSIRMHSQAHRFRKAGIRRTGGTQPADAEAYPCAWKLRSTGSSGRACDTHACCACPSAGPQVCRLCPKGRCPPRCRRTHRPLSSESTVPTPRARCGSGAASRLLRLYLSARGARQVTAPRRPLLPS